MSRPIDEHTHTRRARAVRVTLAGLACLALVAVGAGIAVAATGGPHTPGATHTAGGSGGPTGQGRAGRTGADSLPSLHLARAIDPALVDVRSVIETPSGPTDAVGTGMVVSPDGEIVTNNHVVESAMRISVRLDSTGQRYTARFVGADKAADVAMLQLEGVAGLQVVHFSTTAEPAVGEGVLAIGNALGLGGTPSVTRGRVSAIGRSIVATNNTGTDAEHLRDMIQASALIDPGNSGGPLVDGAGRVVGMTTATASSVTAKGLPLTFAIPARTVLSVVRRILAAPPASSGDGIVRGRRAYLGLSGSAVPLSGEAGAGGVDVLEVQPNSPAWRAGIEADDVISAVDGLKTSSMRQITAIIARLRPGDLVRVSFRVPTRRRLLPTVHTVTARLVPGPVA